MIDFKVNVIKEPIDFKVDVVKELTIDLNVDVIKELMIALSSVKNQALHSLYLPACRFSFFPVTVFFPKALRVKVQSFGNPKAEPNTFSSSSGSFSSLRLFPGNRDSSLKHFLP
jgi:hypothetical protein